MDKKNLSWESEALAAETASLKAQHHALRTQRAFSIPRHGSSMREWIAAESEEMVENVAELMKEFDMEVANPKEREEVEKALKRGLEKLLKEKTEVFKLRDVVAQYKARWG